MAKTITAKTNEKTNERFYDLLTEEERSILQGDKSLKECTVGELEHILSIAQEENDEFNAAFVKQLLWRKSNPSSVYIVKTHEEAIDRLEKLLGLPIKKN